MAPSLLPELVSDILLCLPVASLLRFRCLSTSHCAEIDSANFAKHQLKRSIKTRTGCKLLNLNPTDLSNFLYADMEKDGVDLDFKRHWTHMPISLDRVDVIDRSLNGLILLPLRDIDYTIFRFVVWNPFTKRHKVLPPCPAISLPEFKYLKCFGLGVDSALEEYKVVVIAEFSEEVYQVWIFSLGSNCWRNVEVQHRDPFNMFSQQGYFANGNLYWSCCLSYKMEKTGSFKAVMGFDLAKEQFFYIPATLHQSDPKLAVFEGNVYIQKHDHMCGVVELYRLMCDEHGEVAGGNWVKEFSFNHQIFARVFYFRALRRSRKGDSVFFMHRESRKAFWYRLESKQVQSLEIDCAIPEIWSPVLCLESLVSPGHDSVLDQAAQN